MIEEIVDALKNSIECKNELTGSAIGGNKIRKRRKTRKIMKRRKTRKTRKTKKK
jgi:hypothetical protein